MSARAVAAECCALVLSSCATGGGQPTAPPSNAASVDVGGDPCEAAVKNFATLQYWSTVEAEIAAAPPESRPALRAQKVAELERKLAAGIDMAISQCQAANNDDQIACMTKATTWAEARTCAEAW